MKRQRNSNSKAGQMITYLETHSRQSTGDLAKALGWTSTRVSAAVWAEINRPDAKIVREEIPPAGGRRTPTFVYTHKRNWNSLRGEVAAYAELPKPETTKPEQAEDTRTIWDIVIERQQNMIAARNLAVAVAAMEKVEKEDPNVYGEPQPPEPTEKPAINLTDFADLLAMAIAQHVVARVETHLQERLPAILPVLPNETAPISIEQLTKRLRPSEDTPSKQPTVLIAGLLPNQAGIIDTDFGDVFNLRFFMTDDNLKQLKAMAKSVDHVFTFTSKVSHAVEEVMVGQGHKIHRCSGGMTMLKEQLLKLYVEKAV